MYNFVFALGRGNRTVCAEFNFYLDPEAAFIVTNEFTCPIIIAALEFTRENSLTMVRHFLFAVSVVITQPMSFSNDCFSLITYRLLDNWSVAQESVLQHTFVAPFTLGMC